MKKIFFILCFLSGWIFLCPSFAQESTFQRVEIPSSFNPVGSGARALGMGGAFIAIADDATAASWNPGGLIQLELPEISMVGAAVSRTEKNEFDLNPEASGNENISQTALNYLSAAYPFKLLGRNMIVSLNYQHLYDFTREWAFSIQSDSDILSTKQNINYDQTGQLAAYGLAYSVQITPEFSAGLTFNFWEDGITSNHWKQDTRQSGTGMSSGLPFDFESRTIDRYDFSGFNMNFGVLWRVSSKLTLGAVLKTPFDADISHEKTAYNMIKYEDKDGAIYSEYSRTDEHLTMPMSYGIGIAYKFTNELSGSLDIYRTQWDDFELEDADGNKTNPITGKSSSESQIDATHQVRFGLEYLFKGINYFIPVRGGLFYDPAPSEGAPDDFYGVSIGSGLAFERVTFDLAYQFRFGNNAGESVLDTWGFSQDVREHKIYSSIIINF